MKAQPLIYVGRASARHLGLRRRNEVRPTFLIAPADPTWKSVNEVTHA